MRAQILTGLLGVALLAVTTIASADEVYVTKRGKHYHQASCKVLKNRESLKVATEDAEAKKITPCKVCFKEQALSVNKE